LQTDKIKKKQVNTNCYFKVLSIFRCNTASTTIDFETSIKTYRQRAKNSWLSKHWSDSYKKENVVN